MIRVTVTVLMALLLVGCVPDKRKKPSRIEGYSVEMAKVEKVVITKLQDHVFKIKVKGLLEDTCTSVYDKETTISRDQNNFRISIYVIRPENKVCTQVLKEYERSFRLRYSEGIDKKFKIHVNGNRYR